MLKVKLNVEDNEKVNLILKYKNIPVKTPIPFKDVQAMVDRLNIPDSLDINLMLLDKSRIHPRYTKIINRFCEQSITSYSALSYIGDAFVNFVASILIYQEYGLTIKDNGQMLSNLSNPYKSNFYLAQATKESQSNCNSVTYPLCSSGMLSKLTNTFKSNAFLAQRTKQLGWDKHLVHNHKEIQTNGKKTEKAYADMMEGFIGCLYSSNGMDKLLDVCEVVKNILMPESEVTFLKPEKKEYPYGMIWGSFVFGLISGIGVICLAEYMAV